MARTTSTRAGLTGRRGRSVGASLRRRALGAVSALAVALVGVGVVATAPAAVAATAPDQPTVSSDALPTVQVNGVVWDTAIVGNTVYVAGSFTSARPAGSAAGTNETPRGNLLAFDIRTGELIPSWAPSVNAAAYAITPSPDGTLLYVGGDFTAATSSGSVTSVGRTRLASFSATTGALDNRVRPTPNAAVRAIVATTSTVYFGGNFTTVGGVRKPRVAAVSASNGALTPFFASVQSAQVDALLLTPDGSKLVLAGRFEHISNVPALGTGWVNATTGAVVPFPANQVIQNSGMSAGYSAGITSLSLAGNLIIGAGFHRLDTGDGSVGNLEGMFAADASTGELAWVADCKGDTYSTYPSPDGHIYLAGHPHDCSAAGGFPEASPRVHNYGLAFTQDARVTNAVGAGTAHAGRPSPVLANWFPAFSAGTVTGQNQAGWTVTGNADYVVYGGEFPRVNNTGQAGLVRFAARPSTTAKRGPASTGATIAPTAVSRAAGTAQVSWPVNQDPDDGTLTYRLVRNGNSAAPVATVVHESRYWDRGRLSATDTGLANGTSYSYTVVVTDSAGNSVTSPAATVTTASTGALSTYARTVLADAPANYWRLGDTTATVNTWTGANPGTSTGVTRAVPGGISGDADGALLLTGASTSSAASGTAENATNAVSVESWFKTTTQRGGKIVGFGSSRTGASATHDRQIVMGDDGRLTFGVNPRAIKTITSPTAYNDDRWHHVVATLGQSGMSLYVDGALVASDSKVSTGQGPYSGYWRIGGDALAGWTAGATSEYFAGSVDEVATYSRALTGADVARHYSFGATGAAPKIPPTAEFTATTDRLTVALDARASADADGTVASYDWDFGDGTTGTGATPQHTYTAAGSYRVTLTVTDDDGVKATTAQDVEVITGLPTAAFMAQTAALVLGVDGSTSTDPDGALTFAWSFGDGATETGATATHTYAAAGTYPVTLTVTDEHGQQSTATQSVTVTNAAKVLGRDAFGRTSTAGFGTADLGGGWTTTAGAATVSGGAGVLTLSGASSAAGARLPGAAGATTLTQVSTSLDKVPNGGGTFTLVRGRIAANGDEYRLRTQVSSAGKVTVSLAESVAGKETDLVGRHRARDRQGRHHRWSPKLAVTGSYPTRLHGQGVGRRHGRAGRLDADRHEHVTASLQTVGHVGLYAQNFVHHDERPGRGALRRPPRDRRRQRRTAAVAGGVLHECRRPTARSRWTPRRRADPDGTVESYRWDFGDGTTATGRTASHTYAASGTYTVTLTVTDDTGLTGTTTRDVTVAAAPQPPTASFTTQVSGSGVAVDAAASTDPDGSIATYAWAWGDGTTGSGADRVAHLRRRWHLHHHPHGDRRQRADRQHDAHRRGHGSGPRPGHRHAGCGRVRPHGHLRLGQRRHRRRLRRDRRRGDRLRRCGTPDPGQGELGRVGTPARRLGDLRGRHAVATVARQGARTAPARTGCCARRHRRRRRRVPPQAPVPLLRAGQGVVDQVGRRRRDDRVVLQHRPRGHVRRRPCGDGQDRGDRDQPHAPAVQGVAPGVGRAGRLAARPHRRLGVAASGGPCRRVRRADLHRDQRPGRPAGRRPPGHRCGRRGAAAGAAAGAAGADGVLHRAGHGPRARGGRVGLDRRGRLGHRVRVDVRRRRLPRPAPPRRTPTQPPAPTTSRSR